MSAVDTSEHNLPDFAAAIRGSRERCVAHDDAIVGWLFANPEFARSDTGADHADASTSRAADVALVSILVDVCLAYGTRWLADADLCLAVDEAAMSIERAAVDAITGDLDASLDVWAPAFSDLDDGAAS